MPGKHPHGAETYRQCIDKQCVRAVPDRNIVLFDKDKNFLFRPELGTGSESACIPILTSSTRVFRPAGDVKRGGGDR